MKSIDVSDFQANVAQFLTDAQQETIVVTVEGKPRAVLHGVPDDLQTAERVHSASFWKMIEERHREPVIPWAEAKQQLS